MVTSVTKVALLTQSVAFSGTKTVGVGDGDGDAVSPVTGMVASSVEVFVAGKAVSVAAGVSVSVITGVSLPPPPQADKRTFTIRMSEKIFLDMFVSFIQVV